MKAKTTTPFPDGPQLVSSSARPEATPAPKTTYDIMVYCLLAQIKTKKTFTEKELDEYITELRTIGYTEQQVGVTTIYPSHTINKISVSIAAAPALAIAA